MRIVLVNWAKVWNGPAEGGGVNGYCQALALELAARGHDVVSLCSGVTYAAPEGSTEPAPCTIRRHRDWFGIRVFEVVNSPVLAPSFAQFTEPLGEVSAPELEARVAALFRVLRPDIVHFHNLEGLSIGCVEAARSSRDGQPGARVLFSLHNYHTLCPQIYLMQRERTPCFDFQGGLACATCVAAPDPAEERRRRILAQRERDARQGGIAAASPIPAAPPPAPPVRERLLPQLWRELRSTLAGRAVSPSTPPPPPPPLTLPGLPVDGPESVTLPLPVIGTETRGRSPQLLGRIPTLADFDFESEEWRPLANDPLPDPSNTEPRNDYGRRRAAMVAMLNRCDRVLAVSEFVRRKFEALGVEPSVIRTLHIGSRLRELAERNREVLLPPPPFVSANGAHRPVRMVFMGYNNYYKGLHMLADALELLTPEHLARIHLSVYALNGGPIRPRFRRLEARLAGLVFYPGYDYAEIPAIVGPADLGLVTSVWWDNAPQTVFEYFACGVPVLAAALGGIPDFVRHNHNGLLFRGNDRFDLARQLARVTTNPELLTDLRRNVTPPKGMQEHAAELESIYTACLAARTPHPTVV